MGKRLKNIYLVVGRSGVGKDTIVNEICKKYGYKKLISYTERKRRKNEGDTHKFVTRKEMDDVLQQNKIVGYTVFDGNRYCATEEQFLNSDFYIIDPNGVRYLKEFSDGIAIPTDCNIYTIMLDVGADTCNIRMAGRGEDSASILRRSTQDFHEFANFQYLADVIIYNDTIDQSIKDVMEFVNEQESLKG